FGEEESVLVMLPELPNAKKNEQLHGCVLFLRERDRDLEIWNGRRLGIERAPETLGVDAAYSIDELWERLPILLAGYERVMAQTGLDEARDRQLLETLHQLRMQARRGVQPPTELVDPGPLLHEQRLFKSEFEIDLMQRAADITHEAHVALMTQVEPGVFEYELDALLDYTFRRMGGNGPAYGNIVAGGVNACILHYTENDAELKDGDLLLVDAGCELDCYASDVTRTFPVNGRFSKEQRALYEVVLEAQLAGIAEVRPGNIVTNMHDTATRVLCEGLIRLGLLEGSLEKVLEDKAYRRFYMHGTGHWLGLDVHDCGAYAHKGDSRQFEAGMVTTVEPGLYVAEDDETVEARWRGIGIRIEDDVLVTGSGNRVLTASIPKSVDEVEAACAGQTLSAV
ncbi:MAG: aminopeptidase P N-terminal domain-containing protein, partial [Planctomycetota bacterium]